MSLHRICHAPRITPSWRIQIGHRSFFFFSSLNIKPLIIEKQIKSLWQLYMGTSHNKYFLRQSHHLVMYRWNSRPYLLFFMLASSYFMVVNVFVTKLFAAIFHILLLLNIWYPVLIPYSYRFFLILYIFSLRKIPYWWVEAIYLKQYNVYVPADSLSCWNSSIIWTYVNHWHYQLSYDNQ